MSYPNWDKLDGLTEHQKYRLLLTLTKDIKPKKMDELIRDQKLLSIDAAVWGETYRFKKLCKRVAA